jgi:uncharacterized SAM-binding protein YcdF (DUF218 family)
VSRINSLPSFLGFPIIKPHPRERSDQQENVVAKGRFFGRKIFSVLSLILWLALFLLLVIAFTPLTSLLLKPLAIQEEIKEADLIVVLGGGVNKGRYLTLVTAHRVVRGAQFYFDGKAPKILFSGGSPGRAGVSEASVMAQEARRLRIPEGDMILEKKSRDTHENAVEVKKITDSMRAKSILLITSYSHMKRAVMVFEHAGFKVYPAPADPVEKYPDHPLDRLDLFPKLVHEYAGIVYYKIRDWI